MYICKNLPLTKNIVKHFMVEAYIGLKIKAFNSIINKYIDNEKPCLFSINSLYLEQNYNTK